MKFSDIMKVAKRFRYAVIVTMLETISGVIRERLPTNWKGCQT